MSKLKIGQKAPDLQLVTKDDEPIQLSETWGDGKHVLIIFLRHLA